jgi:type II secretory pathway component GspD/PulD (secretin)
MTRFISRIVIGLGCFAHSAIAQSVQASPKQVSPGDSITIRIVNSELRAAVQTIGQYLDKPLVYSGGPSTLPVTLETPRPIPRTDAIRVLRGLLESNGFELLDDTAAHIFKARPRESKPQPIGPLPIETSRRQTAGPELFVIELHHASVAKPKSRSLS